MNLATRFYVRYTKHLPRGEVTDRMRWTRLPMLSWGAILSLLLASVIPVPSFGQATPPLDVIARWELVNYARVVLEIEPIRQKYYRQAQALARRPIPRNLCFGMSPQNIPSGMEAICANYMREAMQVLKKYNMTVEQFNAITLRAQQDKAFSQRIQTEMLRLKQP